MLSLVLVSEDHAGHRAVARRINDLACDTKGDPSGAPSIAVHRWRGNAYDRRDFWGCNEDALEVEPTSLISVHRMAVIGAKRKLMFKVRSFRFCPQSSPLITLPTDKVGWG